MVREMAGAVVAGMLKMGPQQINCDALLEECRGRRLPGVPEETVDQAYLRIETALGWLDFVTKEGPKGRCLEYCKQTVERDRTLLEEIRTGLWKQPQRDSLEVRVEELLTE